MRRTLRAFQGVNPELHRYSHATFHDGTHRQAPGDSTPWRDVSSPINRLRGWWLAPAAKGSVIAAWCVTLVLGAYCFSVQQDAKGTYLLNNALLRNLHDESQRADGNEQRAEELQLAVSQLLSEQSNRKVNADLLKQFVSSSEKVKAGLVNYELELSRVKNRCDVLTERNQGLVQELGEVRNRMTQRDKDNAILAAEVTRLRKLVGSSA